MIRYIHGSEDSTDVDIHYVFESMPEKNEAKKFCSEEPTENRNIIVVTDGIVTACYKGTVDEINNALIDTYNKHEQEYPLIITRTVPRDKYIKYIRAVRGILSHLSKSQFRPIIKQALKSTWSERLNTLLNIDLSIIDFSILNNNMTANDICKVIAFQIGQSTGLMEDKELYTKSEVAEAYPVLRPYLYRDPNIDLVNLTEILHNFIEKLIKIDVKESERNVIFPDGSEYELIHEECINK